MKTAIDTSLKIAVTNNLPGLDSTQRIDTPDEVFATAGMNLGINAVSGGVGTTVKWAYKGAKYANHLAAVGEAASGIASDIYVRGLVSVAQNANQAPSVNSDDLASRAISAIGQGSGTGTSLIVESFADSRGLSNRTGRAQAVVTSISAMANSLTGNPASIPAQIVHASQKAQREQRKPNSPRSSAGSGQHGGSGGQIQNAI